MNMPQSSKHELELAWAAGFFDGEGTTVAASHKSGARSLHMTVAQVQLENLHRLRNALGSRGHITGPRVIEGRKPIYSWRAYGHIAQECINLLRPYLGREKSEQATTALVQWSFRCVNITIGVCSRGHNLAIVGRYVAKSGRTECAECRRIRRANLPMPIRIKISALEARLGMREYVPPDITIAHAASAWTFGVSAAEYAPIIET